MAPKTTDRSELKKTAKIVEQAGSISAAARETGMSRSAIRNRLNALGLKNSKPVEVPEITYPPELDDDIGIDEIIALMSKRFSKRQAAATARKSQVITLNHSEPIVVGFVGDPHLDDDGCDWPLLLEHIELFKQPRVYGVNVGDTTNNWVGNLMRLFAGQETSQKTARKLAKWFLSESGIKWLVWVMGNHDEWNSGADILRLMNTTGIVMEDWSARFRVGFANGVEVPFWVAHDFPGHSMWNKMHGLMKAAMMRGGAGVYAAGHRHISAVHWEPIEDQDAAFWAFRSKGYKVIDSHATRLGYGTTNDGHTTAVVIDPRATNGKDLLQGFKDLRAAVIYRDALAAKGAP